MHWMILVTAILDFKNLAEAEVWISRHRQAAQKAT
jgi:hypothetical protein